MEDFTVEELAWFRKPLIALFVISLAACRGFQPTRPMPADQDMARAATVIVQCGDALADLGGDPLGGDDSPWAHGARGSAVVISSQLAITAAHVIACPDIPTIHLILSDGENMWSGIDKVEGNLAYLAPWGALDTYGTWINPPTLHANPDFFPVTPKDYVCLGTPYSDHCGEVHEVRFHGTRMSEFSFDVPGKLGLSGAGVWSYDRTLVGIVQGIASNGDAVASTL